MLALQLGIVHLALSQTTTLPLDLGLKLQADYYLKDSTFLFVNTSSVGSTEGAFNASNFLGTHSALYNQQVTSGAELRFATNFYGVGQVGYSFSQNGSNIAANALTSAIKLGHRGHIGRQILFYQQIGLDAYNAAGNKLLNLNVDVALQVPLTIGSNQQLLLPALHYKATKHITENTGYTPEKKALIDVGTLSLEVSYLPTKALMLTAYIASETQYYYARNVTNVLAAANIKTPQVGVQCRYFIRQGLVVDKLLRGF